MGVARQELALTAILFTHPRGLTLSQLVRARDRIHTSEVEHDVIRGQPKKPLDYYEAPACGEKTGLARIAWELKLRAAPNLSGQKDSNGIPIETTTYEKWDDGYRVRIHVFNRVEATPRQFQIRFDKSVYPTPDSLPATVPGQYEPYYEDFGVLVQSGGTIIEESDTESVTIYNHDPDGETVEVTTHYWVRNITGFGVNRIFATESFPTEEELHRAWPELRPENYYDYSQPNGEPQLGLEGGDIYRCDGDSWVAEPRFRWQKIGNRYHLDPEILDRIPVGMPVSEREKSEMPGARYGYTDLILTVLAIKHRAWKMLSINSLFHLDQFFAAHPSAKEIYERAVWDGMTSLAAKSRNLTTREFLRLRLMGSLFNLEEERLEDQS
jgi:hypothetical protein